MILYVIRHAEAVKKSKKLPDEWRYLTKNGRAAIKKMRSKIAKHGPKPSLIITSPLVRTVQTAEIFAEKLQQKAVVIASGFLHPEADITQLIKHIKKFKDNDCVMIVGHEPFLGSLVAKLLQQTDHTISLKKGACVALEAKFKKNKKMNFLWYIAPGSKLINSFKKAFL